jgi:hypothetical protein
MQIEVDQSGKLGDTRVPTVLAFSNATSYAILIPATVKRVCLQELRRQGQTGTTLYLRLFAVGLFLLLKDHVQNFTQVTIDVEYPGHNDKIKEYLLALFRRAGLSVEKDTFRFDRIHRGSKKPAAHDKAYYTFQGKMKPDKVITLEELLSEAK